MMLIAKRKSSGWYSPVHTTDEPIFRHCTEGFIAVKEIAPYLGVFINHGIQIMIQDETLSKSKGEV